MLTRYKDFLAYLDSKLEKMFESQKAFIKCQKGCSYCCTEGEFPMSVLEFVNMMFCFESLSEDTKTKIQKNIDELLSKPKPKFYQCPFLIEGVCSIYPERPIICRTFGLIWFEKDRKKIPFCVDKGLNYSNVFDQSTDKIVKNAPDGTEPLAFNISREALRSKKYEKEFDIYFGDDKTLYDFLKEGGVNVFSLY